MAQTSDSNVQVSSGTGPSVRTLQLTVLDSGTPTVVQMEVIAIADEFGNPLKVDSLYQAQMEVLDELRAIRLGLQEIISAGARPNEVMNLIQVARELRHDPDDKISDEE